MITIKIKKEAEEKHAAGETTEDNVSGHRMLPFYAYGILIYIFPVQYRKTEFSTNLVLYERYMWSKHL